MRLKKVMSQENQDDWSDAGGKEKYYSKLSEQWREDIVFLEVGVLGFEADNSTTLTMIPAFQMEIVAPIKLG